MDEKKSKKKEAEKTPSWLKTIQLNSWEAELLISALVLYTLFQVPDYLNQYALSTFERGSYFHNLFKMLESAVRLLSLGYILHILIRGIWVATIGLSYVFPNGINQEKLKFKGNFKKELDQSGSLVKMVLRLEELSSIIYGISFILFGTLAGFATLFFSIILLFELLNPALETNPNLGVLLLVVILFYLLLCLILFIDFMTNGYFRRKEWSADWFYYVSLFFRVITLSFLYRRSILVLVSNIKGWKSYLIPFLILAVTGGYVYLSKSIRDNKKEAYYTNIASGEYISAHYENTRSIDDRLVATIQSDIVHDNFVKLFLNDLGVFGGIYLFDGPKFENGKWDRLPSDSVTMYFNKRLTVFIDELPIDSLIWFKTQHPKSYDFGFTTFIDLQNFEKGPHFLKLGIDTTGLAPIARDLVEKENYSLQTISNIYFIYDKP